MIDFYRWLARGLRVEVPLSNDPETFYRHRERFNALLAAGAGDTCEAASLFYYLNRTGFNGLCRFNSRGEFNVPFGRHARIVYRRDFSPYVAVLRGWTFTAGDFEQLALDPSDFVYADPPYDVPFTAYARGGFGWADQERAARWAARHAGPVILVNQATERILALYESLGFTRQIVPAPRRISCNGNRRPALEVIATRNLS